MLLQQFPLASAQKTLFTTAYRLGVPLAYEGEREGKIIHDIQPIKSTATQNTSLGINRIGLHTEMAFHHFRPSHVLLFCLRNERTHTWIVSTEKVLSNLSPSMRNVLSQSLFQIEPPRSYKLYYAKNWKPLLENDCLVLAEHCFTTFKNKIAKEVYQETLSIAYRFIQPICLRPGDLLIIDNQKYLHGREEIVNNPTRWLKRMYVGQR